MKKLLWIAGISIAAVIAFLIPEQQGDIWTSVVNSMAVAGIFFVGLIIYVVRKSKSTGDMITGILIPVVLAGLLTSSGIFFYNYGQWNYKLLTVDIRESIQKGIMIAHIQEPLLKTLKNHHLENADDRNSLKSEFHDRYGDQLRGVKDKTRYIPPSQKDEHDEDPPFLYYDSTDADDKIVLVGQSLYAVGADSAFKNYDEVSGRLQYKGILTEQGVRYVREN